MESIMLKQQEGKKAEKESLYSSVPFMQTGKKDRTGGDPIYRTVRRQMPDTSDRAGHPSVIRESRPAGFVVQKKLDVGVSLYQAKDDSGNERAITFPVNPALYRIDTIKLSERSDTDLYKHTYKGMKLEKSKTQGAHTIADAFIKKHQKLMVRNKTVPEAQELYKNMFQQVITDNWPFLQLYSAREKDGEWILHTWQYHHQMAADGNSYAQAYLGGMCSLSEDQQKAVIQAEETEKAERIQESNRIAEEGIALCDQGEAAPVFIIRKNLVDIIRHYNDAYARSALFTWGVGTPGKGEAGGMAAIKKTMSEGNAIGKENPYISLLDMQSVDELHSNADFLKSLIDAMITDSVIPVLQGLNPSGIAETIDNIPETLKQRFFDMLMDLYSAYLFDNNLRTTKFPYTEEQREELQSLIRDFVAANAGNMANVLNEGESY